MKNCIKKWPLCFLGILLLLTISGCDLLTGPAGESGGNIPGGWLEIGISGATSNSVARIVFDPDINVLDGDEFIYTIPLSDYISSTGYIFYDLAWRALDIPSGSYFLYAWIDINGDGSIEIGSSVPSKEEDTLTLYSDSSYLNFDSTINPSTIINDSGPGYDTPIPNYVFWEDFAPQVYLYLTDGTGW